MSRYALLFPTLGALLVVLGFARLPSGWLLVWLGLDGFLLGAAYGLGRPELFGKRADGRLAWWSWALFGPYLGVNWLVWQATRLLGAEPCWHEISPKLWLGRRPYRRELPEGSALVVDLTSEFPAAAGVLEGRGYVCVPLLDGTAGRLEPLRALIAKVAGFEGGVYVHCAQGHGRSAMVVAAVLRAKGLAADAEAALERVRWARPGIRLNAEQRARLDELAGRNSAA